MPDGAPPPDACPCAACVRSLYERAEDLYRKLDETYRTFNAAVARRQASPGLKDVRLP